ncbi:glycosyltransferase family 2 protein [Halococcus sp. IIIV-5B]|uniref:glycosyltransferase family 2 protein n=1 Tax=Halococcus sp. IIIV-5B TaxID=2321230 RepID=UPI000E75DD39|nr:glycosyltransferase family 2 protein [Halococcus sp. IIIV-5B]RJT02638.1 glycosyltransferase family 2 protein [Halococcus sp. IIIV-5B]
MYNGKTVGVVVPAHNEETFVGRVIETMPAFVDRVYAVDDRSTDGTWAEIQRHAERANRERAGGMPLTDGGAYADTVVEAIRHDTNRGRGGAVKTGYRHALEDGLDIIAVMDADGQMNPDMLSRIIEPVADGRADYAKGTRLLHRDRSEMSNWRFFGNSLLTYLTKISSGYWRMSDPQNGFTAVSYEALSRIDLDSLYDDYGFLNDMLTTLNVHDFRVADVSHPAVYGDEQSGIRYSTFIPKLSTLLARNFVRRLVLQYVIYSFHPLVLLYFFGIVSGLTGLLGVLVTLASAFGPGEVFLRGGLSMLLLVVGGIAVSVAMAYDLQANAGLEVMHEDRFADDDPRRTEVER